MTPITIPLGSTGENCYLYEVGNGKCVIIDPGYGGEKVLDGAELHGLRPAAILFTHMHFDHIMGTNEINASLPSPLPMYIHKLDKCGLTEPSLNLSSMAYGTDYKVEGDVTTFEDGDVLVFGGTEFRIVHTPGHTPGSSCFEVAKESLMFTGDTLFHGSMGRTDFPGGDFGAMKSSLARLAKYPTEYRLYPGHGESTDIAKELRTNPYLSGDGDEFPIW